MTLTLGLHVASEIIFIYMQFRQPHIYKIIFRDLVETIQNDNNEMCERLCINK